jgi:UDP-N-acetylglucosamine 4,6-dehydratase (inverting)
MKIFKNKSILITGGTGSFGKNFINYLLRKKFPFARIIIFSRDEFKQDQLQKELDSKNNKNLRFFLGDVRDKDRLLYAFKDLDFVIHAAALKQVPAAEYNPIEFIKTNVLGAQNIIEAALENNVNKVLALSTDKAVAPINLYGATKLCSDKLFISANNYVGKNMTKFSVVRYGNVLGSRGSILPEFLKKKSQEKIFNITDLNMTRFNILMNDAIDLVVLALNNAMGGEIFVPKLKSFKVTDLAKAIDGKCKFKVIGIRPGEKLHEELITVADSHNCFDFPKYFLIIQDNFQKRYSKKILKKKIKFLHSYNSEKNIFLSVKEIKDILLKNFQIDNLQ